MNESVPFMRPMHHLSINPRGKWVIKLTVSVPGSNTLGKRVTIQTGTSDSATAMAVRSGVFKAYRAIGMVVTDDTMDEM